jgi:hypothetical protein
VVKIKWEQTLVAPLGELPDPPTFREAVSLVEKEERRYRKRTLLGESGSYTVVVKTALEAVRATEGVLFFQRDGGGLPEGFNSTGRPIGSSVLLVAGVHGTRSVYVLRYGREYMWVSRGYGQGPRVPKYGWLLLGELHKNPEARRELAVLEGRLCDRYPALKTALEKLKGQDRLFSLEAVERGQLLFLVAQTGEIKHALVGTSLVRLNRYYRMDWEEEILLDVLRREDSLRPLPPELLKALLRGEGDVEEAERRLALARLAEV